MAQRTAGPVSNNNMLPSSAVAMNVAPTSVITPASAEAKEFKGMVVDELGDPLAGAVVSVVVGNNQFSVTTTTNAAGEYTISTTSASPLLLVTYAGCVDTRQKATYAHPLTFQLEEIRDYDRQLKKQAKKGEKTWSK